MTNKETKFIYLLSHPSSDKYYIGQAFDLEERYKKHLKSHKYYKKNFKDNWIKSLLDLGLKPDIKQLAIVPTDQADFFEIMYIDLFLRLGFQLVNGTFGGANNSGGHTEETKRKIAESNTGKKMSPEHNHYLHQVIIKGRKAGVQERLFISRRLLGNKFRQGVEPANKGSRKLTESQVNEIKNRLDRGEKGKDLATEFNTSQAAVSEIKHGKYYDSRRRSTEGDERNRERSRGIPLYLCS